MNSKIMYCIIIALLLLQGLLFICNIYVLGDVEAAIAMHEDLAPTADPFIVNGKVIVCFITGILYLLAAYGIIRKNHHLLFTGILGIILFLGYYIIELFLWGASYPRVWLDFSIFGGLSLIMGVYLWQRRKRKTAM